MGILGRRAVWKGPFFVAFNLPKLNAAGKIIADPAQDALALKAKKAAADAAALAATAAKGKKAKGKKDSPQSAVTQAPVILNQLRTDVRQCTILPSFVGQTFHVHNGRDYIGVLITEDMIGHRLGEFAHTKKPCIYNSSTSK